MEANMKLSVSIRSPFLASKSVAVRFKRVQLSASSSDGKNSVKLASVGDASKSDIWKLFNDAQQNILHLYKQRLTAFEELKRIKDENKVLLDRIEQLEAERTGKDMEGGPDKVFIAWEWLLKIDSLVLKNMVTAEEAAEMRTLVMNSKTDIAEIFNNVTSGTDEEFLSNLHNLIASRNKDALHVIHICTEMEPLISTGPLASYVTGISCALQKKGNFVEVILPMHTCMELNEVQALKETEAEFYSYFDGQYHANRTWTGIVHGIGVTFIQPVKYSSFFDRDRVSGYADDFERFSYFSRASLDYILKSGKHPDVLHIHNWETAIVAPLFWDVFVNQGLEHTRIMLTCHTFDSECHQPPEKLAICGLDPSRLNRPDRLQHNSKMQHVDVLKGGVVYSNKVVVTSSFYSKGKCAGSDLESTLSIHKDKLVLTNCGFNASLWDPFEDKFLPETYTPDDMDGKAVCKLTLQQRLGFLEDVSTPIIGCFISDLSDPDIESLQVSMRMASKMGCQLIIVTGNKVSRVNQTLESLKEYKDPNVRFAEYDEALFHLVLAGSDIFLCSSLDDPVFQIPLKAMKYGAAPIAITLSGNINRNITDNEVTSNESSQFIAKTFSNMSLNQAVEKVQHNPLEWYRMITDAMRKDFSWDGECCDLHISAYTSIKNL